MDTGIYEVGGMKKKKGEMDRDVYEVRDKKREMDIDAYEVGGRKRRRVKWIQVSMR